MSEPWNDYAQPAEDGPWSDYARATPAPSAPKRTSQSLGFMKGVAKPLSVGEKVNPLNLFDPGGYGRAAEARRDASMANYFAKREETEKPGAIGEVVGNIVGTIPAVAVTRNPFVAGGLQGAMLSDARSAGELGRDVIGGAVLSWGGGKVVNAVADVVKPAIAPAVRRLTDAGVRLTPGMVKGGKAMAREDKLMSRPVVGDVIAAGRGKTVETFNMAAVDEALKPLGKKVPSVIKPGNDAIDYAKGEISRAYDTVIPNLSVKIDGQRFAQNILPAMRNLKPAEQKQLRQIITNELGKGQLADFTLKRAQSEIRRLAGKFSRSQSVNEQLLGDALRTVDDELTSAMIAQNPKWAPQLQKVNEAYRGYRIVADAAGRADEGLMSTSQLKQAVRRGDFSKSKDATGRGKAFMQDFSRDARKVIPAKTPDSGTAGRMQAQNLFANLGGQVDALKYRTDDAFQQFRLAPRPAGARKAARTIRRLKGPAGAAAIAAASQDARD